MKTRSAVTGAMVCSMLALLGPAAVADGVLQLRLDGPEVRLSYALPLGESTDFGVERVRLRLGGLRVFERDLDGHAVSGLGDAWLLGDYYFAKQRGFRATGGMLRGERRRGNPSFEPKPVSDSGALPTRLRAGSALRLGTQSVALPYLGMGYTERSVKGNWSFSADVGMVMLKPRSAVKLGAAAGGSWLGRDGPRRDSEADLPGPLSDWRLSPVIQLGVSYTF